MKKTIFFVMLAFTTLMAIEFTMTREGLFTNGETTIPNNLDWIPKPLPIQKFNVRNYGLKGDGRTDDSSALKRLAKNTSITNWYFPSGYSFLLSNINIPSHVDTIFGGANIISKAYTPLSSALPSPYGAFKIENTDHTNLLINNLHFTQEDGEWAIPGDINGPSGRNTRWFGHITIDGRSELLNTEIRNCSFSTEHFEFSCIKISGGTKDGIDSATNINMRIHHNEFTKYKQFGIEIIGIERNQDGTSRNVMGMHVNDNYFHDGGMTMSLVILRAGIGNTGQTDGTENRVYRNKIDNGSWGIETGDSSGLYVYENHFTNIRLRAISASYRFIEATGKNFVFNNHMEIIANKADANFEFYDGNPDEYYGNYFKGHVYIRGEDSTQWSSERRFGNFHDNTFVLDDDTAYSSHIRIQNAISGIFKNNKIYSGSNVSRSFLFNSKSGSSNIKITDNNIYLKNKWGIPITEQSNDPIYQNNNTVVKSYTGSVPIER